MRIDFDDYPRLKPVVSLGIALHEGALFSAADQVMVLWIAPGVIGLRVTESCSGGGGVRVGCLCARRA